MTTLAALVVLIVIVAIASPTKKPVVANLPASSAATPTPAPTVPVATGTPETIGQICAAEPSNALCITSAPTSAPTAAPTARPTAAPTAAPVVGFTKAGRGDTVFSIPAPYNNEPTFVRVSYTGGDNNFSLTTLGSDNSMEELLVNVIGNYHGAVAMDFDGSNPAARMQVSAVGPWSMTFEDPTVAQAFATSDSGNGDAILQYNGSANTAAFTSNGQGNFAVLQYDAVGQLENLLVNTVGPYSGSVPIDPSGYLVITDDGRWTVSLSSG